MILKRRTRGEPLVVLVILLVTWVGARMLAWEVVVDALTPGAAPPVQANHSHPAKAATQRLAPPRRPDPARSVRSGFAPLSPAGSGFGFGAEAAPPAVIVSPRFAPLLPLAPLPLPLPLPGVAAPLASPAPGSASTTPAPADRIAPAAYIAVAGGHQMLWLAVTAYLPLPPLGLRTAPAVAAPVTARRWSGDGWLLLRRGDGTIAPGPVVGNYGASQIGAVLRYRLVTSDPRRPAAYVRATAALNGTREQQAAFGLSARPLPRLPVTAMAELRGVRDGAGQHLRPALVLVTELPPQRLPLGFTGELYAQGGYVGGRSATAFIDGLVRAERPLADLGAFRLRAGGGAWAAKQRGAARVDVGPTASVSFRLTDAASARVAADWRFRVGGASKPDSGPALTLSAGF